MKLILTRDIFTDNETLGVLKVFDKNNKEVYECYTLEDKRGDYGKGCAIKPDTYRVVLTFSQRFQKILPLVCNVKNRSGIRFHAGNTNKDTTGCILVGEERLSSMLLRSRPALGWLLYYLQQANDNGEQIILHIREVANADGKEV